MGLPPQDPRSLCPLSSKEFVEPPHPEKIFLRTPPMMMINNEDLGIVFKSRKETRAQF
jgi:hypothetical protein